MPTLTRKQAAALRNKTARNKHAPSPKPAPKPEPAPKLKPIKKLQFRNVANNNIVYISPEGKSRKIPIGKRKAMKMNMSWMTKYAFKNYQHPCSGNDCTSAQRFAVHHASAENLNDLTNRISSNATMSVRGKKKMLEKLQKLQNSNKANGKE